MTYEEHQQALRDWDERTDRARLINKLSLLFSIVATLLTAINVVIFATQHMSRFGGCR
jgi:hypothetical protein